MYFAIILAAASPLKMKTILERMRLSLAVVRLWQYSLAGFPLKKPYCGSGLSLLVSLARVSQARLKITRVSL